MKQSKSRSDWFFLYSFKYKELYRLEIFGVTPHSNHCMRLLKSETGKETDVFHLDDIGQIKRKYGFIHFSLDRNTWSAYWEFNRQNLIRWSEQLQAEGKGQVKEGTKRLIQMVKRRQNDQQSE